MNRCPTNFPFFSPLSLGRAAALALTLASAAHLPAQAQVAAQVQTQNELTQVGGRNFPVGTLRGKLAFGVFPEVELDGRGERLAPGARIRNAQNIGVMPASVAGQYLAVNYRRDAAGLVSDVWILTAEEAGTERASAHGTPFLNFWPFTSRADNERR